LWLKWSGRSLPAIALACFLLTITSVGIWYQVMGVAGIPWAASLALVSSLTHFWYDGFIRPVRNPQIWNVDRKKKLRFQQCPIIGIPLS
jgi:hypothetical protein